MSSSFELDCGKPHAALASWLDDELKLARSNDGRWQFDIADGSCFITVEKRVSSRVGELEIERCRLSATGDNAALDEFKRRFWLRFASAGG